MREGNPPAGGRSRSWLGNVALLRDFFLLARIAADVLGGLVSGELQLMVVVGLVAITYAAYVHNLRQNHGILLRRTKL